MDSIHAFEMSGIYFRVYLMGSCYLIPSLNHRWPNVCFAGMWLSWNDIMCWALTLPPLGDSGNLAWVKNCSFIFTLMSITYCLPTREVTNGFGSSSSHADC